MLPAWNNAHAIHENIALNPNSGKYRKLPVANVTAPQPANTSTNTVTKSSYKFFNKNGWIEEEGNDDEDAVIPI